MEISSTLHPFILVKTTSYQEESIGYLDYPDNIVIQTNQGPMLAAKIEKFQNDNGDAGIRTVLLTMADIGLEPFN